MSVDITAIVRAINEALPIAEQLAKLTATLWDDRAVALLRALLSDQALLDFLKAIIGTPAVMQSAGPARTQAIHAAMAEHGNVTVQSLVSALGFAWTEVLEYLPLLVRLLMTVLGARS